MKRKEVWSSWAVALSDVRFCAHLYCGFFCDYLGQFASPSCPNGLFDLSTSLFLYRRSSKRSRSNGICCVDRQTLIYCNHMTLEPVSNAFNPEHGYMEIMITTSSRIKTKLAVLIEPSKNVQTRPLLYLLHIDHGFAETRICQ